LCRSSLLLRPILVLCCHLATARFAQRRRRKGSLPSFSSVRLYSSVAFSFAFLALSLPLCSRMPHLVQPAPLTGFSLLSSSCFLAPLPQYNGTPFSHACSCCVVRISLHRTAVLLVLWVHGGHQLRLLYHARVCRLHVLVDLRQAHLQRRQVRLE